MSLARAPEAKPAHPVLVGAVGLLGDRVDPGVDEDVPGGARVLEAVGRRQDVLPARG